MLSMLVRRLTQSGRDIMKTHTTLVVRLQPYGSYTAKDGTVFTNKKNRITEIVIKRPMNQKEKSDDNAFKS